MSYRVGIVIWRINTWGNVLLENLIGLCGTFHRLHEDQTRCSQEKNDSFQTLVPAPPFSISLRPELSPWEPLSATRAGWGWKEGHSTELYTGRLRPEAQPLNLLCNSFDRKNTPFMLYWYPFHAPSKNTASLLTIVNAPSFHDTKPRYLKLWIRQWSFCPFHSLRCVCQPAFKSLYRTKWWISLPFQNLPTLSYAWSLKRYVPF